MMEKGYGLKDYRPEQFLAEKLIGVYLDRLKRGLIVSRHSIPLNYHIELEYPIRDWQSYPEVEGVRLKGMPQLDILLIVNYGKMHSRIGIRINGQSHNTHKRQMTDEDHKTVLEGNNWIIIDFDYDEMPKLFALKEQDAYYEVRSAMSNIIWDRIIPERINNNV